MDPEGHPAATRAVTLAEAARSEVVSLYTDFDAAIVDAAHRPITDDEGTWSMRMIEVADRITAFGEYLRPIEPDEVPVRLVSCGWFAALAARRPRV